MNASTVKTGALSIVSTVTPRSDESAVLSLPLNAAKAVYPVVSSGAMSWAVIFTEPAVNVNTT